MFIYLSFNLIIDTFTKQENYFDFLEFKTLRFLLSFGEHYFNK